MAAETVVFLFSCCCSCCPPGEAEAAPGQGGAGHNHPQEVQGHGSQTHCKHGFHLIQFGLNEYHLSPPHFPLQLLKGLGKKVPNISACLATLRSVCLSPPLILHILLKHVSCMPYSFISSSPCTFPPLPAPSLPFFNLYVNTRSFIIFSFSKILLFLLGFDTF